MVKAPRAAADAAEIEAQHGKTAMHEGVIALIDDLMIHVAAELRMRVQHDGDRRVFLPCRMIPAFDPAGGAGEDNLGHFDLKSRSCGKSLPPNLQACLTIAAAARK